MNGAIIPAPLKLHMPVHVCAHVQVARIAAVDRIHFTRGAPFDVIIAA